MPPKARSERSKSQSKNASKTAKANATKGEGNAGSTRRTTRQQRLASASASQSDSGATSADEEDEDVSEMNDEEDEEMSTPVAADKTKWRSSKVNGEMQSDADASSPLYSAFNKPRAKSGIKYGSSSSSGGGGGGGGGKNQVQAHANLGATSGSAKSPNRATKSSSSATERMFGNVVSGNVNREEVKQGAEQEQARARAQSRPGGKQAKHATKQQQQQQQQQERDELQDEEVDGKQRKKREKAAGGAKKSKKATSTARTKMDKEVTSAHSEDADVVDMVVETQAGVVPENAIAGFLDNYDLESSRQMSTLQASLSHSLSLATQQMSLYITRLPSVVRRMTLGEFVREYEADAKLVMSRAGKGRLTEGRGASVRGVVGVESEDWDKLAEKTKGRGKRRGEEEDDDHEKSKNGESSRWTCEAKGLSMGDAKR
ncbi:hypothetical protein IE81DRAFT_91875 [Ceraceosorus guamensis]|uniref:Borealin N-terminal domain-containing protein n=1 Tax=Ceraceosorus guamensis TaxID=1522189 RepID=A0A316VN34_9BASI|nr:hypothetical protein IE81DRAFT_91875 [Ceraceosorus guamensis]PWN38714.1 hypothetical protein IE81DRAFT_91875 [Ceraceosorus guamensis]